MIRNYCIYKHTCKKTCLERLASDDKRKMVREQWSGYIDDWFERYQP